MFQKLPLSTLERVDMVSDATVGYIYSYPCPFLMMEAVSEILEMYSIMTWLIACKDFSATYVVRFSVLFLSLHFFFSATIPSQISYQLFYHQRPALYVLVVGKLGIIHLCNVCPLVDVEYCIQLHGL